MPDITQIAIGDQIYDIKDAELRTIVADLIDTVNNITSTLQSGSPESSEPDPVETPLEEQPTGEP